MKKINFMLLLVMLIATKASSQGENNNWYFGDRAAVNFSGTPVGIYNSQMTQLEGVASISDSNGNLLFYTNGVDVWNREHQIMTNGTGLTGNDTTQQVLIVPYPLHPDQYYIFTTSVAYSANPVISYSIVNMALGPIGVNGNPLGDVMTSNVTLQIPGGNHLAGTEAITCTLDNLNSSYWILIPHGYNLYTYKLSDAGLSTTPLLSNLPLPVPSPFIGYGEIKVSPNLPSSLGLTYSNLISFTRWANTNTNENVLVINSFDNATGLLTSDYQAMTSPIGVSGAYSAEFSSDGLLLYTSQKTGRVHVFDLFTGIYDTPPNVPVREIFNQSSSVCYTLQRAINNQIYLSTVDYEFLSRIDHSNSYFLSNVVLDDILIDFQEPRNRHTKFGLPQLVPIANSSACVPVITLTNPETYNNYTYNASQRITTLTNYSVSSGQNITFRAGESIVLQSNTVILSGSSFWASISPCTVPSNKVSATSKASNLVYINMDEGDKNAIRMYPNPVTNGTLFIESTSAAPKTIVIYDILGKDVLHPIANDNAINVSQLKSGIYLVKITQEGNSTIHKLIIE